MGRARGPGRAGRRHDRSRACRTCWSGRSPASVSAGCGVTAAASCSAWRSARSTCRAPGRSWPRSPSRARPADRGRTVALTLAFAVGTAVPLLSSRWPGARCRRAGAGVPRTAARRPGRGRPGRDRAGGRADLQRHRRAAAGVPDYTAALNKAVDKRRGGRRSGGEGTDRGLPARRSTRPGAARTAARSRRSPASHGGSTPRTGRPLPARALKGKVVLVDFWAYSCINCQRAIPHSNAWYQDYAATAWRSSACTPRSTPFEHVPGNVAAGAQRLAHHVSDRARQRLQDLERLPQRLLARRIPDRRQRARFAMSPSVRASTRQTEWLIRQLLTGRDPASQLPKRDRCRRHHRRTEGPDAGDLPRCRTRGQFYAGAAAGCRPAAADVPVAGDPPENPSHSTAPGTSSKESLTAKRARRIELNYYADDVYLDIGGTGTVTATVNGKTHDVQGIGGAPNIYTLVSTTTAHQGTSRIRVSSGLMRLLVHLRLTDRPRRPVHRGQDGYGPDRGPLRSQGKTCRRRSSLMSLRRNFGASPIPRRCWGGARMSSATTPPAQPITVGVRGYRSSPTPMGSPSKSRTPTADTLCSSGGRACRRAHGSRCCR